MNTKTLYAHALLQNLANLEQHAQKQICVMVKADAYGHGLSAVLSVLQNTKYTLGVFSDDEGVLVRKQLPHHRICVFGHVENIANCVQHNLEVSVHSLNQAKQWYKICKHNHLSNLQVHLAVNTGMHRFGITDTAELKKTHAFCSKHFQVVGVYTHFCTIESNEEFFQTQQMVWQKQLAALPPSAQMVSHVGGGFCLHNTTSPMLRVGLLAYGYGAPWVTPCLKITSKITEIHTLHKGDCLGYDQGFIAQETMRVGVVPLGYGDGLDMRLKNKPAFLLHGKTKPILGNICMDCCFIPLDKHDAIGDTVELLPATTLAQEIQTSVYEVLCNFARMRGETMICEK